MTRHEVSAEETQLYNDIAVFAAGLWGKCKGSEGLNRDPKIFSVLLFKRLWSNHQGFTALWIGDHLLEAAIILRSAVETAICLAANNALRAGFVELLRDDAIATLKGHIRLHRDEGHSDLVKQAEATLRNLQSGSPNQTRPVKLDWKDLADKGGVRQLYTWHRQLSGFSSHVTGVSVLDAIGDLETNLGPLQRKQHFMMIMGATVEGSRRHTELLEDAQGNDAAITLMQRLAEASDKWMNPKD